MVQFNELLDVPESRDPFSVPSEAVMFGSNYQSYGDGDGDDEEIRRIRRRITPFGKVAILAVIAVALGTGYFVIRSATEQSAMEQATTEGLAELQRITSGPLAHDQLAAGIRDVYARYKVSSRVRMSARRFLSGLSDPQAVPLLVEGLYSNEQERRQAALGLAEIGLPSAAGARDALFVILPKASDLSRAEVVWAMVALNDSRCWDAAVELLASGKLQRVQNLANPPRDIFDTALLARMAGRERLVSLVSNSSVALRRIAALSLAEMASPDIVNSLITLAGDADTDVAREAAIGLGRAGDPRGGGSIVAFLNAHPDLRDAVLAALSQNSGARGIGTIIQNVTDPKTRSVAVHLLRELRDPGAGDTFVRFLRSVPASANDEVSRSMRNEAIFGLAEIGDSRAAEGLIELAMRPLEPGVRVDPNIDRDARLALDSLRKIPDAPIRVKQQLLEMVPRAEFMRTQVLFALAATADPSVGRVVLPYLSNIQSYEGAAVAVCRLGNKKGIARVRRDMVRPRNHSMVEQTVRDDVLFMKRRSAIRAIAWAGDPGVVRDLETIIEDPLDRGTLREEAGNSLAAVASGSAVEDILSRATDLRRPDAVRLYYLYALRVRSTPAIANRLVETYLRPGVGNDLMRSAAIAAGLGGDQNTATMVRSLISSSDVNIRLNASIVALLCGEGTMASTMLHALSTDREFARLLSQVFVRPHVRETDIIATQQEPLDLEPLTDAMFMDGRVYRRIDMATKLEQGHGEFHHDFLTTWLRLRLRRGWSDSPSGVGSFQINAWLRDAVKSNDSFRREMALKMLRLLNDRGTLLFLRRLPGEAGERARRYLFEMNGIGA